MTDISGDVWLGIDLGTQSVRALAVTDDGHIVGAGTYKLTSTREQARHEQDPEEWWRAVSTACAQALRDVPNDAVQGVAVDGTSGTVLLIDSAGQPLTPGLMYDDGRAAAEAERVNEVGEAVWSKLGYGRMQAVWALPKLLWLLRRRPTLVRGARLAMQTDFINRRLVGHDVATDLSTALKTGADLITEDWPHEVMSALDVPGGLLPPLVRSGAPLGNVSNDAAEATGIPVGTPVYAGATDGCAAQLGAGVVDVGSWNSVLGTTLVLKGVTRDLLHDPQGAVYSHKAPNGTWLPGGASSTGAGAIARDFADRDLAALENEARRHGRTGVIAYPLVSDGERFPFVAPQARPFILGTPRDDAERYAAVLQGVAFIERLAFDHLDLLGAPLGGRIVLTGGGTKSAYWSRLRADVLRRPLDIPENAEPALGMAVVAAASGLDPAEAAARMVRVRETVEPGPGPGAAHDDAYLRLVGELESRGWLPAATAAHVRKRTTG